MGWAKNLHDRFDNWHEEVHQRRMEMMGKRRGFGHRRGGWFGHGRGFGGNPFGSNPFGGNPFARRARMKRGDVRAAILALLTEGPRNGYQVMQELEQRSNGVWRPSPGSVYPAFQQLEDEGLIRAEESGSGKVYRLTSAGEAEAAKLAKGKAPWEALGDEDEEDGARAALFTQVKQLGLACLQIAHAGNEQQTKEAAAILNGARKSLYAILARDAE
jgi:DNA-binding PadR family transcriptional regulator